MYELLKRDGAARRGRLHTVHGVIETPVFMNVGTAAAIKGAVSTEDLERIGTQVELSNTYHLHVRPGDQIIRKLGGLHKFMSWEKPILTDSGGFQVFSLAGLRRIKEEGVYFNSHIDGKKIFMGPEESMQIQSNLASTIAMAFDECPSSVADREYMERSVARTTRWLERCKREMDRLNSLTDTINRHQMLFGINQGGVYEDIRISHAKGLLTWIWTATLWAASPWANPTRRCTAYWTRLCPIFPRKSHLSYGCGNACQHSGGGRPGRGLFRLWFTPAGTGATDTYTQSREREISSMRNMSWMSAPSRRVPVSGVP